jgi:hypothetical protein
MPASYALIQRRSRTQVLLHLTHCKRLPTPCDSRSSHTCGLTSSDSRRGASAGTPRGLQPKLGISWIPSRTALTKVLCQQHSLQLQEYGSVLKTLCGYMLLPEAQVDLSLLRLQRPGHWAYVALQAVAGPRQCSLVPMKRSFWQRVEAFDGLLRLLAANQSCCYTGMCKQGVGTLCFSLRKFLY